MSHRPRATGPKPQTLFPAKVTDYDTEGNHIMTDAHWLLPGTLLALLAGGVRGYTGFGFAMTLALGLLWLLPPLQVIVVVLMLDILGALGLARRAWKAADRTLLARLVPAMFGMSLLGTLVMTSLPYHAAKLLISGLCLIGAVATFLPTGLISRSRRRDKAMAVPAGAASGLAMAVASAGGPPLMLYLMHTTLDATQARATAIVFFIAASSTALFGYSFNGAVPLSAFIMIGVLLPAALMGAWLGQYCFHRFPPVSYRKSVSPLLIVMALWILVSELWPGASGAAMP